MTKLKNYPDFHILSTEQDKIFWTISEVSERLEIEPYTLRFWEKKFTKLRPTQKNSGTRYYKINDIHLIEKIRDLLYKDGYTIDGAIKALNKKAPSKTITKSDYKNLIEHPQTEDNIANNNTDIATELLKEIKKKYSLEEKLNQIVTELEEIEELLN